MTATARAAEERYRTVDGSRIERWSDAAECRRRPAERRRRRQPLLCGTQREKYVTAARTRRTPDAAIDEEQAVSVQVALEDRRRRAERCRRRQPLPRETQREKYLTAARAWKTGVGPCFDLQTARPRIFSLEPRLGCCRQARAAGQRASRRRLRARTLEQNEPHYYGD